jgi:hypothetical protein
MIPHNEHIMYKFAQAEHAAKIADAEPLPEPWASLSTGVRPSQIRAARRLVLRGVVALGLLAGGVLAAAWVLA